MFELKKKKKHYINIFEIFTFILYCIPIGCILYSHVSNPKYIYEKRLI